jgi:hypothetical protein
VKKFKHYFLKNNFIFFVDHQTLLYLVNKPTITSRIAKWLLLLQEFDFKLVYKSGRVHFLPYHLFRICHEEPTEGVDDHYLMWELISMVQL